MALSYKEVCEELSKLDETTLLEVLDITSEDLVANLPNSLDMPNNPNLKDYQLCFADNKRQI